MCGLRVFAWLRVKLKVKGTGVRSFSSFLQLTYSVITNLN